MKRVMLSEDWRPGAYPNGSRRRRSSVFGETIMAILEDGLPGTPLKINMGSMSSWRFGSDHFPFQMGDL